MARTAAKKTVEYNEDREVKPIASNQLKIRLDNLKTFDPLTDNQKLFFDAYKRGDYFVALHGVAGTGKTFCALYKAIEEVLAQQPELPQLVRDVLAHVGHRAVGAHDHLRIVLVRRALAESRRRHHGPLWRHVQAVRLRRHEEVPDHRVRLSGPADRKRRQGVFAARLAADARQCRLRRDRSGQPRR